MQTRKRPGEAAPRALREEAPLGPLRSGSDWAMESMSELAPRCLLLPLLLLPLLLLPAPKLGPSSAGAEETDWVRLPSKCEGEGAGPRGVASPRGGRGRGLWEGSWAGVSLALLWARHCLVLGLWDSLEVRAFGLAGGSCSSSLEVGVEGRLHIGSPPRN